MYPLFESIKIKDGKAFHLDLHQQRMDRSVEEIFEIKNKIKLSEIFVKYEIPDSGLFKFRIAYTEKDFNFQLLPYKQKSIKTLKLLECNEIQYPYKFSDREKLNELQDKKNDADEIIIVKNGLITDSSYSNLVFWNGEDWHTPSTPLLNGIQREYLISQHKIKAIGIGVEDLKKYQKVGLINAMMDLEDMPVIEIHQVL